jgi:hypothetical protein
MRSGRDRSSRCSHLAGTVDDLGGDASAGVSAGVSAVGVVVGEVLVEVASQGGELGEQGPGEAGTPAFLADGELDAFDAAVAGGAAGFDAALAGADGLDSGGEVARDEL